MTATSVKNIFETLINSNERGYDTELKLYDKDEYSALVKHAQNKGYNANGNVLKIGNVSASYMGWV